MKTKSIGMSAGTLKQQAKKLRKVKGIKLNVALDLLAQERGFENYRHFQNSCVTKPPVKNRAIRPAIPIPAVRNYHDIRTGVVLGQRPNRKMAVRRHRQIGEILAELSAVSEYHKRAKSAIREIRLILDNWLGCEYEEMGNEEFNAIYYGRGFYLNGGIPSAKRQAQLRRMLRTAKTVIDRSYHDCKPLAQLHLKFDIAMRALEKWPKRLRIPGMPKDHIRRGTFVRLNHNKQIGVVISHDTARDVVEAYSDAGYFVAGRHEVTVMRQQPNIEEFKPMRICLPYGKWICEDGREVLFNRDYTPIWQRSSNGWGELIEPETNVLFASSSYYYDDRSAPYYNNEQTRALCLDVLKEWGTSNQKPIVLERLPGAIAIGNLNLIHPKGIS